MPRSLTRYFSLSLALGVTISGLPLSWADPGDINSINNVTSVVGGTYYNTPGTPTKYNATGSGLVVGAGTTVQGLEVNSVADPTLTGNGGYLQFNAPGQLVRIDGTVDVRGLIGGGYATSNGGRVEVNSAMLYQNGNIYANGTNGGLIQFNVGSATFTGLSKTEAMGLNGNGGQIFINATGNVNIQSTTDGYGNTKSASLNTSGRRAGLVTYTDQNGNPIHTFNTNLVEIKGGLVNIDGIVTANGTLVDGIASQGGTIKLTASQNIHIDVRGKLIANGADGQSGTTTSDAGAGGDILLTAQNSITNKGLIQANGGAGGNADLAEGEIQTIGSDSITVEIDLFSTSANPDKITLNDLKPGEMKPFTIASKSVTDENGNILTLPALTVEATYAEDGSNVTVVFKNGSQILGEPLIFTPQDQGGTTQGIVSFNAELAVPGFEGTETVLVSRNFNLNTNFFQVGGHGNPSSPNYEPPTTEASINLTVLPQLSGDDVILGNDSYTVQESYGENGGQGGQGGTITFTYDANFNNDTGTVEAKGGNGGKGGDAYAEADIAIAIGGDGGDGGNGGTVTLSGPKDATGAGTFNVSGGTAGIAGTGTAISTSSDPAISSAIAANGTAGVDGLAGLYQWILRRRR